LRRIETFDIDTELSDTGFAFQFRANDTRFAFCELDAEVLETIIRHRLQRQQLFLWPPWEKRPEIGGGIALDRFISAASVAFASGHLLTFACEQARRGFGYRASRAARE